MVSEKLLSGVLSGNKKEIEEKPDQLIKGKS